MSFAFFSSPSGGGEDAENAKGAGEEDDAAEEDASARPDDPSERLLPARWRARYSSRSPPPPPPPPPPSPFSPRASTLCEALCAIFVASLNMTPNVPSLRTYPRPYLLV